MIFDVRFIFWLEDVGKTIAKIRKSYDKAMNNEMEKT